MPSLSVSQRSSKGVLGFFLALTVVVTIHLVSAGWHVLFGALNADEGFYAVATRAVAQGEMPYRDFGFTQPPLVLYANALPMRLLGFGLFEQRVVNGLWAAAALGLAAVWLLRRAHPAWALALLLLFSLSAPWMYFIHLGKTYAVTTALGMLASWVFLAMRNLPRRNFLLGLLAALGVASRLPAAPFFGVLWLFALWPNGEVVFRKTMAAIGGVVLGLAVTALPIWLASPEAFRFWIFDFQRISVPLKHWHLLWQEIAALAPAVWLLGLLAFAIVVFRHRLLTRESGVILAATAALLPNLLLSGVYEEYGIPFLLPLATAAIALISDELRARSARPLLVFGFGVGLLIAQLVITPVLFYNELPQRRGTVSRWLPYNAPPYNRELPRQLAISRQLVDESLPPSAPFIGPNLILAAETGRVVPPELRMGSFSVTDEMPPAQAARLHLATREQLSQWFVRSDVTVISFFERPILNYDWSMPSFTPMHEAARLAWIKPLSRDFTVAFREGDFLLLIRKRPAAAP
jgi:4-amino-4-deoxy-L-arabinose transferase-like glycosyltransferase